MVKRYFKEKGIIDETGASNCELNFKSGKIRAEGGVLETKAIF